MSEGRADHQDWDELAAGYALDALEADEELRFTEHLETCERCANSVADHELVAAGLGAIAHPAEAVEPPAWDSMRAVIIGTPQEHITTLASRRRRYDVSRRALSVAAAGVAVAAAGGIVAWQATTGGSSCTARSGCHTVHLDAGAKTAALLTVRGNTVTLNPTGIAAAPAGKIYVLWQQPRDAKPTLITEFTAAPGSAPASATLPDPYGDTQLFAVSLERATSTPPTAPSNLLASGNAA